MANAFKQKQDQNMTKAQNATGGDFTLTFAANGGNASNVTIGSVTTTSNAALSGGETTVRFNLTITLGMPPPAYGPNVYLLYDGSLAMGELVWKDGKQWLRSFNPVGMTPLEIAASKIHGWASAGPRRGLFV